MQFQHLYIPEKFNLEDTIFHYCKLNTAIEFILHKLELRLSPRKESHDPLESSDPMYNIVSFGHGNENKASHKEADEIRNDVISKLHKLKQVCFCMNNTDTDYSNELMLPYEYYGFLKPRMWHQYADNYKGVCLAFSKKELLRNSNLIPEKINYLKYDSLNLNESINLNALNDNGFENYFNSYFEKVEKTIFRKHIDYIGESEFRLCTYSDSEFDYIDISKALIGIIAPQNNISDFALKTLDKYADRYNIDLLYLLWQSDRIFINSKKGIEKITKTS